MRRPWQTWVLFALCLAVVFGALGWVSATAARLERSEGEARRWAAQQENVRLALWRMDSAMAPLIAQESARPYFAYRAFYRVNQTQADWNVLTPTAPFLFLAGECYQEGTLAPSPLLTAQPPFDSAQGGPERQPNRPPQALLYFQFGPEGELTSPQVPTGDFRGLVVARYTTAARIDAAAARLAQLGKTLKRETLLAELPFQQLPPQLVPAQRTISYAQGLPRAALNAPAAPQVPAQPQVEKQAEARPSPQPAANQPGPANTAQQDQNGLAQQSVQQAPFAQTRRKIQDQFDYNDREFQARNGQNWDNIIRGNTSVQAAENGALPPGNSAQQPAQQAAPAPAPQKVEAQKELANEEFKARSAANSSGTMTNAAPNLPVWNARELQEGVLKPLWAGADLVLARRVRVEGRDYVQGCLLDWPGIRASLLASTHSLLPEADLTPVIGAADGEVGYMMASLPVRLIPGPVPQEAADGISPVWLSLGIAWACVLAAAAGGAVVLARAMSLSERRGAFVSAVTHELRTPLTTFKMYAEMLADNMVPDEAKRRQYLETLRAESVRLGHLVENVLAYARLERGRAAAPAETITLEELMARQRDRLAARAEQSGMELVIEPGEDWQCVARADVSSVEQILFNLVDNACKYAGRAADPFGVAQGRPEHGRTGDRRIHVAAGRSDGFATLTVRDHGPGIPQREARRLFRAFRKSAREAANSAPGIGLGLALSRRMARRMGGGLRLDPASKDAAGKPAGASFTLLLPQG